MLNKASQNLFVMTPGDLSDRVSSVGAGVQLNQDDRRGVSYLGPILDMTSSQPISINSERLSFTQQNNTIVSSRRSGRDPLQEYQPLVKNLKNIALRNRNFIGTEKVVMPVISCEALMTREPGVTSAPYSP